MQTDISHRNYLSALFLPLLASIFIFGVMELAARSLPSPYKTKFEEIQRQDRQINTLILGSSHFYFGVNPSHFASPALNAANVSQDFKYDFHILKTAVTQHDEIKHVVVPLSIFSLYSELDSGIEYWRKYSYRHYMGFAELSAFDRFDLSSYSVFLASQNRLGLIKRIAMKVVGRPINQDWTVDGWGTAYSKASTYASLLSTGKQAALRHQKNASLNDAAMVSIEAIAELCHRKGIKLLLITPPAFLSYRDNIDEVRLTATRSIGKKIATSASGAKYIDYFDNPTFEPEDFADADHLNHRGAEKLSRMIDGVLKNW